MTVPATFSFDAPGDAARAAELRRVKALATLVLAGTLALFVVAKLLLPMHPAFGFVAAFAEAATIGGLADWYAVVALFRRPLGLPIPHTAIIQSNQHRIADKLGEFIEVHFLEAAPVDAKLRQIDFGSFIADWLRDRKRSADLARFALRLLPEAVVGDGNFRPDDLRHPPHHHAVAVDRSGAARRRHAARLRGRGPASGPARRHPARGASIADPAGNHGDDPREDPRRIADAAKTLSRRQIPGEQDRRLRDRVLRRGAQRSQASVPRRVRSHGAVVRRPARQRPGLCRSHRRPEARSAGASRTRRSRAQHLVERAVLHRAQRQRRDARCCSSIWRGMFVEAGEALAGDAEMRGRDQPGPRRRARAVSSPTRRAASPASSPIRSRPGTWGS